jgi:hypothetical protein
MSLRPFLVPFCAVFAGLAAACAQAAPPPDWQPVAVSVSSVPLYPTKPGERRAGDLVFAGGLELAASAKEFGGFSGLLVDADGRLTAVSDQGIWLAGRLEIDPETGDLVGLSDTKMAGMRDENGQPLVTKDEADAEDLARLPDGRFAVSFEHKHRILIYDLDAKGPAAPAERGPAIATPRGMNANEGLEGLAALADGRLVGMAEFPPGRSGTPFWIFPAGAMAATSVSGLAERPRGFGVSALTRLPDGNLIALERFFLPMVGVRINVRLIPAIGLDDKPPTFNGSLLATLESPLAVDNFEAVAAVAGRTPGTVRLYMLADDNFSDNQRTLLYAFDWTPPGAPTPPPPAEQPPAPVVVADAGPVAPPAAAPPVPPTALSKPAAAPAPPPSVVAAAPAVRPAPPRPTRVATAPPRPVIISDEEGRRLAARAAEAGPVILPPGAFNETGIEVTASPLPPQAEPAPAPKPRQVAGPPP